MTSSVGGASEVESTSGATETTTTTTGTPSRKGAAGARGRHGPKENYDLNSLSFSAEHYARRLMATSTLQALGERERELLGEITNLDSEMKTLVYENYSKFISATETIRKMRAQVEAMEGEMQQLVGLMEGLEQASGSIQDKLAGPLSQVHEAWEMEKTLQQRKFLFELPSKLRTAIAVKAYHQATAYYVGADPVLTKFSHVSALHEIKRECDAIISGLVQSLRTHLASRATPLDDARSAASQLLDLHHEVADIRRLFIESQLAPLMEKLADERAHLVEKETDGPSTGTMHNPQLSAENLMRNDPAAWSKIMDPVYQLWPSLISVASAYQVLFLTVANPVEVQLSSMELARLRDRFWEVFQALAVLAAQSTVEASDTLSGVSTMYVKVGELQAAVPNMFSARILDSMTNRIIDRQVEFALEDARMGIRQVLDQVLALPSPPSSSKASAASVPAVDLASVATLYEHRSAGVLSCVVRFVDNMRAFFQSDVAAVRSTEDVLFNRICVKVQHLLLLVPERVFQLFAHEDALRDVPLDGLLCLASVARELQAGGVARVVAALKEAAPHEELHEVVEMHTADLCARLRESCAQLLTALVARASEEWLVELYEFVDSEQWASRKSAPRAVSHSVQNLVRLVLQRHEQSEIVMRGCSAGLEERANSSGGSAEASPLNHLGAPVRYHPKALTSAQVLRVWKAYVELGRLQTLSGAASQQFAADSTYLLRALASFVEDSDCTDYYAKEMAAFIAERCPNPLDPLAPSKIDEFCAKAV